MKDRDDQKHDSRSTHLAPWLGEGGERTATLASSLAQHCGSRLARAVQEAPDVDSPCEADRLR